MSQTPARVAFGHFNIMSASPNLQQDSRLGILRNVCKSQPPARLASGHSRLWNIPNSILRESLVNVHLLQVEIFNFQLFPLLQQLVQTNNIDWQSSGVYKIGQTDEDQVISIIHTSTGHQARAVPSLCV